MYICGGMLSCLDMIGSRNATVLKAHCDKCSGMLSSLKEQLFRGGGSADACFRMDVRDVRAAFFIRAPFVDEHMVDGGCAEEEFEAPQEYRPLCEGGRRCDRSFLGAKGLRLHQSTAGQQTQWAWLCAAVRTNEGPWSRTVLASRAGAVRLEQSAPMLGRCRGRPDMRASRARVVVVFPMFLRPRHL